MGYSQGRTVNLPEAMCLDFHILVDYEIHELMLIHELIVNFGLRMDESSKLWYLFGDLIPDS